MVENMARFSETRSKSISSILLYDINKQKLSFDLNKTIIGGFFFYHYRKLNATLT